MDAEVRREQKRLAAIRFRENHPELVKQRNREQYQKNREKRLAYAKQYWQDNKAKLIESDKRKYHENKEEVSAKQKQRRKDNAEHFAKLERKYDLWSKYRLTPDDLQSMWNQQKGLCANNGCKTMLTMGKSGYCIDHDHATGVVRGLLCRNCNLALGHAKDSLQRLHGLIDYLEGKNGS